MFLKVVAIGLTKPDGAQASFSADLVSACMASLEVLKSGAPRLPRGDLFLSLFQTLGVHYIEVSGASGAIGGAIQSVLTQLGEKQRAVSAIQKHQENQRVMMLTAQSHIMQNGLDEAGKKWFDKLRRCERLDLALSSLGSYLCASQPKRLDYSVEQPTVEEVVQDLEVLTDLVDFFVLQKLDANALNVGGFVSCFRSLLIDVLSFCSIALDNTGQYLERQECVRTQLVPHFRKIFSFLKREIDVGHDEWMTALSLFSDSWFFEDIFDFLLERCQKVLPDMIARLVATKDSGYPSVFIAQGRVLCDCGEDVDAFIDRNMRPLEAFVSTALLGRIGRIYHRMRTYESRRPLAVAYLSKLEG